MILKLFEAILLINIVPDADLFLMKGTHNSFHQESVFWGRHFTTLLNQNFC